MGTRVFRQSVPRPENFEAASPPPWATRFSDHDRRLSLSDVRSAIESQGSDAPFVAARSAVLVPLFEEAGETHLVLIRRAMGLVLDPGHIAFPGGRIEEGETEEQAALREAEEEVGITASQIDLVEPLPMAYRQRDRQAVAPFVGFMSHRPTYAVNDGEVDAVIEVPLATLFASGVGWQENWHREGAIFPIAFFADEVALGDDLVWGLTARILWDLLDLISFGFSERR